MVMRSPRGCSEQAGFGPGLGLDPVPVCALGRVPAGGLGPPFPACKLGALYSQDAAVVGVNMRGDRDLPATWLALEKCLRPAVVPVLQIWMDVSMK